jgi:hypothetical protein
MIGCVGATTTGSGVGVANKKARKPATMAIARIMSLDLFMMEKSTCFKNASPSLKAKGQIKVNAVL